MSDVLQMALSDNPLTRPVLDGRVQPGPFSWAAQVVHPSELFWRQLHTNEFDVFEMSMATCFRLASLGDDRWVPLPIFTRRQLCHLSILVREGSGIVSPDDLRGKRIGVPEYQQTSAVWSRGVLRRDFGVAPEQIEWFMERGDDHSHGAETAFVPPAGVRIERIAPDESIGSMLRSGELDGTLLYLGERNLVDRSPSLTEAELGVRALFREDAERARWGSRPLHATHCVAVRRELAEAHPDLPRRLREAFDAAKGLAGAEPDEAPYGLAPNRAMLAELADHVHDQGIAVAAVTPERLFRTGEVATGEPTAGEAMAGGAARQKAATREGRR